MREPEADRTQQIFLAEQNLRNVVPEHFGSARLQVFGEWSTVRVHPASDQKQTCVRGNSSLFDTAFFI